MMAGEGLVYTGVWTGDMVEEGPNGGGRKSLLWTLVLVSDAPYPSAYGATGTETTPNVLHGKWDNATKKVKLTEVLPARGGVREYEGVLEDIRRQNATQGENGEEVVKEEKMTVIRGTWVWGDRSGKFACCKESDSSSNISGFWLGQAKPAKELAPFCIPTNPIRWCASLLPAPLPHSPSTPTFFGCGFFDDSGDVPGKSLLFYSLRGKYEAELRKVEFVKVYEDHNETEGYEVEYTGELDNEGCMRGKWINKKGGSHGKWLCRQQGSSPKATSAICLCDVCNVAIKPGEVRWSCATCLSPWFCCGACAKEEHKTLHPHELIPEGMYYQETAQGTCCAEVIADAFKRFGGRGLIGWRLPAAKEFNWLTYDDVFWHTKQILFGLRDVGTKPKEFALICADLSPAYLSVMLGAMLQGLILLPIHGCLGQSEIEHILRKTTPSVYFVSTDYLPKISQAIKAVVGTGQSTKPFVIEITNPMLQKVGGRPVTPPKHGSPNIKAQQGKKDIQDIVQYLSLEDLKSKGLVQAENGSDLGVIRLNKDAISAVLFTSGSTGTPKGAMFSEDLMMPTEGLANVQPFIKVDFQAFDPSFALSLLQTMMSGGSRIMSLSMENILQDFQIGRPTHIGATPIFWNGLYQEYLVRLSKEARINETAAPKDRRTRTELGNRVASQVRSLLGNRLMVATSGGAPISPEVLTFLKTKLRLDIIDLYGSRETGGITRDGIVYAALGVKLLSVPDLGYYSTSNPPQGEICVHSPRLIPGYWNDEALTNETFIEIDGKKYYRTNDIGEMHESTDANGKRVVRLKVIDRVSSVLKLSSGEWISTSHIETVLENSPWVSQCLILGSPTHPYTVAVVVPSMLLQAFWKAPNDTATLAKAKTQMLHEIRLWAVHHHLRPLQIPQNIYLESTPWTVENGLLTGTEKKRRKLLQARYVDIQKQLYAHAIDTADQVEASSLSREFVDMLNSVFPMMPSVTGSETLGSIGGDSLSAARLCNVLRGKGVEVQLKNIFDYSLLHLSQLLTQATNSIALPMANFHEIDWAKEATLPTGLALSNNKPGPHLLLTGCTGFLGPVLLAEILSQYPTEVKVYCLVRAKSDEEATARIKKDMETAMVWEPKHADRIVGLAGDISRDLLGIKPDVYKKMVKGQVGGIFHSGAWVNMALPYNALKPTNVTGTLSIIKFALQAGGAFIHFVSSVAAIPSSAPFDNLPVLSSYEVSKRDGYGQTKVIAEILLAKAHAQFGLPIQISRPSAISGHSKNGFTNKLDFSSLLLKTMVAVKGVVRDSTVILHWVPVDFVARAIVSLSILKQTQNVFNIVNSGPQLRQVVEVLMAEFEDANPDAKPLETLTASQWSSKVEATITTEHPLYPLRDLLKGFDFYGTSVATEVASASTQALLLGYNIEWCKITRENIADNIRYLLTNSKVS